jgi:hypothetical protein
MAAEDERPEFDLFTLLQGPANMMNGMKGLADNGRKAVSGLLDTIASLQRAAAALEQLASRVDRLVTELETPLRLLTPELEKAANRVLRVAELVEGPIDRLLPGLEQAVGTFERLSVNQLPDNLDALRSQVATVVDVFAEFPKKLGSLGGFGAVAQLFPGLERLTNAAARLVPGSSSEPASSPSSQPTTSQTPSSQPPSSQPMSSDPQLPQSSATVGTSAKSGKRVTEARNAQTRNAQTRNSRARNAAVRNSEAPKTPVKTNSTGTEKKSLVKQDVPTLRNVRVSNPARAAGSATAKQKPATPKAVQRKTSAKTR